MGRTALAHALPKHFDEAMLRRSVAQALQVPGEDVDLVTVVDGRSWRVDVRRGGVYCVKAHTEKVKYLTEVAMYEALSERGAPVPALVFRDTENFLLGLEWAGEQTLEDVATQSGAAEAQEWVRRMAGGLASMDAAIVSFGEVLSELAHPGQLSALDLPSKKFNGTYARQVARILLVDCDVISRFCGARLAGSRRDHLETLLEEMTTRMTALPVEMGCLDPHPRNVIIGEDGIRFVDLEVVGWDWPVNRLFWCARGYEVPGGRAPHLVNRELVAFYMNERRERGLGGPDDEAACNLADWIAIRHYLGMASFWVCRVSDPWEDLKHLGDPRGRFIDIIGDLLIPTSTSPLSARLREALSALLNGSLDRE